MELRAGDRLLVGAETQQMADQLVEEWRQRRERALPVGTSFHSSLGLFAAFSWTLCEPSKSG